MTSIRKRFVWMAVALAVALVALAGGSAHAAGGVPHGTIYYFSTPGGGNLGGVAYADEDVLRYAYFETPKWSKVFDGTDAGLPATADIDAYARAENRFTFTTFHYMSFDTPVNVPGLGKVDDSDIVLYKTTPGDSSWSMFFDGSAHGLTTTAEDIDGLYRIDDASFMISTTGKFTVPGPNGTIYKGDDQDIVLWDKTVFTWIKRGVDMGIPAANDLNNLGREDGRMFYTLLQAATISGLSLEAHDVTVDDGVLDGLDIAVVLDGGDIGLAKIDALDVVFP